MPHNLFLHSALVLSRRVDRQSTAKVQTLGVVYGGVSIGGVARGGSNALLSPDSFLCAGAFGRAQLCGDGVFNIQFIESHIL